MTNRGILREKLLETYDEMVELEGPLFFFLEERGNVQLELFWLESPFEYQFLVITHDENRENREVIINGPYSGIEFLEKLEEILKKPRWQQPIKEPLFKRVDSATRTSIEPSTRQDVMITAFQGVERTLGKEFFKQEGIQFRGSTRLDGHNWLHLVRGNIFDLDSISSLYENEINPSSSESVDEEPADEEPNEEATADEEPANEESKDEDPSDEEIISPSRKETNGLGTYIYEPVWIGDVPELDFKDRILINPPMEYDTIYADKLY